MQELFIREDESEITSSIIISCEYLEQVNTATNVTFGCCVASSVIATLRVTTGVDNVAIGETLEYYHVADDVRTKIGVFEVVAVEKVNRATYKITGYDMISKLDMVVDNHLRDAQEDFPMTAAELAEWVCDLCDVSVDTTNLLNSTVSIPAFYSDFITARDVMGCIAELGGCFVRCKNTGVLEFAWYASNSTHQIAPSLAGGSVGVTRHAYYINELKYDEFVTASPSRIQIHVTRNDIGIIYPTEAEGTTYEVVNNILLGALSNETLLSIAQNLYNRIITVNHTPFQCRIPRTDGVRAGDIISIIDADGNNLTGYIMRASTTASGTSLYSTGTETLDSTAAVAMRKYENTMGRMMTIEQSVDKVEIRASSLEGNVSRVTQTVEGLETEVESLSHGLITPSYDPPETPTEGMLWLDTSDEPNQIKRYHNNQWETISDFAGDLASVYDYVQTQTSSLQQSQQEIRAEITDNLVTKTDYDSFVETVRNALSLDATGATLVFERIREEIASVDDKQQENYDKILKYIRFVDGNIILGEEGNEVSLTLRNNRIYFSQGGKEVFYAQDNKLFAANAEIVQTLQLGKFAFTPQANGNLSLMYVG